MSFQFLFYRNINSSKKIYTIINFFFFNFSDTPPALKNHRYNKIAKKIREQEALAIYDSSEGNAKVPKSKGGKGVKSSSKIPQKLVPPLPGNSTHTKSAKNTSSLTYRNRTQKAASATSGTSKPICKPAYLAKKV